MPPQESTAPYLLFFRNTGAEVFKHLSPDQRQQLITRWNTWYDGLVAEGKASNGQPLEERTRIVAGPAGHRVIDGPYPEAKEAIGGYVVLHVGTLAEATAHAQRHPGLEFGMMIEIRQMLGECHLGIKPRPNAATA